MEYLTLNNIRAFNLFEKSEIFFDETVINFKLPCGIWLEYSEKHEDNYLIGMGGYIYLTTVNDLENMIKLSNKEIYDHILKKDTSTKYDLHFCEECGVLYQEYSLDHNGYCEECS